MTNRLLVAAGAAMLPSLVLAQPLPIPQHRNQQSQVDVRQDAYPGGPAAAPAQGQPQPPRRPKADAQGEEDGYRSQPQQAPGARPQPPAPKPQPPKRPKAEAPGDAEGFRSQPQTSGPVEFGGDGQPVPSPDPRGRPVDPAGARPRGEARPPAVAPVARPAADPNACLQPADVTDRDGDIRRNAANLGGACIKQLEFTERGVPWIIHVISRGQPGPLWAVPHDNENSGFDSAVYGMARYGGTIVAVETGGQRMNHGVDPNRNYGRPGMACAGSSRFTDAFVGNWQSGYPIIALHTNEANGGHISIDSPPRGSKAFPSRSATGRFASKDTMVILASTQPAEQDGGLMQKIERLNGQGVHVMAEHVTASDCSFSNFAAQAGIREYYNVEVVHGDTATQERIVDLLMSGR